ncbi:flippase activity-associated protein Agl23 [Halorientalis brevis]|uniref:Flippase activity-associated protein Agl23 n=1 Tax=Halorientalis brevis TaxID=1126241 RepID=A0ABD6CAJ5_9EURY|nr:flippase activity-associated protein Agl23 [Halorientalis brevis]
MATVEDDDSPSTTDSSHQSETGFLTRYGVDRLTLAVGAVVAFALLIRLFALGERTAHWDEARVGWWILDYMQTGDMYYRPIIHGPFYHHVNALVFDLFGVSDANMRLVVALLGGLTPLAALGLRERLRDVEVGALALLLAVNPLLLYYSRFMRGDPLVAFFMLFAFVLFVRLIDTGRRRYLFAGVACVALATTAKENVLIYLVTWLGATVLLLDHRLLYATEQDQKWSTLLWEYVKTTAYKLWHWLPSLLFAILEFVAIIVYFYAPRGDLEGTDLEGTATFGDALNDPTLFPAVIEEAVVGSWKRFFGLWVNGGHQDHSYLPYLGDLLETLGYGALALCLLAVLGFVVDRYAEDGPRDVVAFSFYAGFVSVLGYPIITDIQAPWAGMHAVVPLAIPAAVGVAVIVRWGRSALARDDSLSVGLSAMLLLVIVGFVAFSAGQWVYMQPQSDENKLVQYAQPAGNLQPSLDRMAAASDRHDNGTDVLLYGSFFVDGAEEADRQPACAKWFNSLPLPWYFEKQNSTVSCADDSAELSEYESDPPPVIITRQSEKDTVRQEFPDYWLATYELRSYGTETVFLFHPDYATEPNATG